MRKILITACILSLGLAFTMAFAQTSSQPPDPIVQNISLRIPERTVLHVANPGGDWNVNLRENLAAQYCYRISKTKYEEYSTPSGALRDHLNTDGTAEGLELATTYPPVWTTITTNDTKGYLICIRDPNQEKVVQVYSNTQNAQRDIKVALRPKQLKDESGFGGFFLSLVKKGTAKKKLSVATPQEAMDMFTREASTTSDPVKVAEVTQATGEWLDFKVIEARLLDGTEKVASGEQLYEHTVVFTAVAP